MKYSYGQKFVCVLFAFFMIISLCIIPAFARSSPTLDAYRASCTAAHNGRINITIDVSGVNFMDKIGATTIYLYESSDGEYFTLAKIFYASAWPAMMATNTNSLFVTPVYYPGTVGKYYAATVYFYAELNGVSDTKKYETASVRAIS